MEKNKIDRILCLLEKIEPSLASLLLDISSYPAEALSDVLIEVEDDDVTLTVPSTATHCFINVKGDGTIMMRYNYAPTGNNYIPIQATQSIQLKSVLEMSKVHFKSTSTNQLFVTFFKYKTR